MAGIWNWLPVWLPESKGPPGWPGEGSGLAWKPTSWAFGPHPAFFSAPSTCSWRPVQPQAFWEGLSGVLTTASQVGRAGQKGSQETFTCWVPVWEGQGRGVGLGPKRGRKKEGRKGKERKGSRERGKCDLMILRIIQNLETAPYLTYVCTLTGKWVLNKLKVLFYLHSFSAGPFSRTSLN